MSGISGGQCCTSILVSDMKLIRTITHATSPQRITSIIDFTLKYWSYDECRHLLLMFITIIKPHGTSEVSLGQLIAHLKSGGQPSSFVTYRHTDTKTVSLFFVALSILYCITKHQFTLYEVYSTYSLMCGYPYSAKIFASAKAKKYKLDLTHITDAVTIMVKMLLSLTSAGYLTKRLCVSTTRNTGGGPASPTGYTFNTFVQFTINRIHPAYRSIRSDIDSSIDKYDNTHIHLTPGKAMEHSKYRSNREDVIKKLCHEPITINKRYYTYLLSLIDKPMSYLTEHYVFGGSALSPGALETNYRSIRKYICSLLSFLHDLDPTINSTLYFSWDIDRRGRLYPLANQLSPIGIKIIRPLFLCGSNPSPDRSLFTSIYGPQIQSFPIESLSSLDSLYRAILHLPDRIRWFMLSGLLNNKQLLAVEVDAMCSAYQHISCLIRDPMVGIIVHTYSPHSSIDLYTFIADKWYKAIREVDDDRLFLFDQLFNHIPIRTLSKHLIITIFYGTTTVTHIDQLSKSLTKQDFKEFKASFYDRDRFRYYRINSLLRTFCEDLEGICNRELIPYLVLSSGLRSSVKLDSTQVLPDGFVLDHRSQESVHLNLKISHQGESYHVNGSFRTAHLSLHNTVLGVTPNLIHALDSYIIAEIIRDDDFVGFPIHDCVLTDPIVHRGIMRLYDRTIINTYSNSILRRLCQSWSLSETLNASVLNSIQGPKPNGFNIMKY